MLTGGPGCGKSFISAPVVSFATARRPPWCWSRPLAGPPRLAELRPRSLHRSPAAGAAARRRPKYDRANPLDADLVVVDESSMMDVILANKLIKAIPPGAHLLLVGDVDQLPPSAPAKYCATCSPPTRSRGCASPRSSAKPSSPGSSSTPTASTAASRRSSPASASFYWFVCEPSETPAAGQRRETADLLVDIVARRKSPPNSASTGRDVQVLADVTADPPERATSTP